MTALDPGDFAYDDEARHADQVGTEPQRPVCNRSLARGWCVLTEGHPSSHLPLPFIYPPFPTTTVEVSA